MTNEILTGDAEMAPTPDFEPQSTFFLAKWTVEIALGLIGLLTAYILKIKGQKVEVVTRYQLKAELLQMKSEIKEEMSLSVKEAKKEIIEYIKETNRQ